MCARRTRLPPLLQLSARTRTLWWQVHHACGWQHFPSFEDGLVQGPTRPSRLDRWIGAAQAAAATAAAGNRGGSMSLLLPTWLWLSVGIFEILAVWFCSAMWVFEYLNHDDDDNNTGDTLLVCGLVSLVSVLVYGIACTSIPRGELRSSDKRKRMASQRGHMTILMYGLGCGAPGELLRVSYTSGYNGEKGASIDKVWRAYSIHQLFFTLPQIVLHALALSAARDEVTVVASRASLVISLGLFTGLAYSCTRRAADAQPSSLSSAAAGARRRRGRRGSDSDSDSD